MSILLQPIWFDLRPYIRVELGRITIMTPSDPIVRQRLLSTTMSCVSCGKRINPITAANGGALLGGLVYQATCGLETCELSIDAREEYDAVVYALKIWKGEIDPISPRFQWS